MNKSSKQIQITLETNWMADESPYQQRQGWIRWEGSADEEICSIWGHYLTATTSSTRFLISLQMVWQKLVMNEHYICAGAQQWFCFHGKWIE